MADSTLSLRSERIVKFLLRTCTATIEQILAVAGSSAPSIRRDLARLETGGIIPWAWSFSLTGNAALTFLNDVYMDKVFLSITGLEAERGVTSLETDEALVYRKMVKQAKEVIVVADSSKLGKVGPAFICP